MDNKKLLGSRLKELRKRKGLTQEKLAELVELEPASICNIENGYNYPSLQNLEKIVTTLEVTFSDIFNFEHHKSSENLIDEINNILNSAPDKISDIYKIVKALTD